MIHDEDVRTKQKYAWHVDLPYHMVRQAERMLGYTGETKNSLTERAIAEILKNEHLEEGPISISHWGMNYDPR